MDLTCIGPTHSILQPDDHLPIPIKFNKQDYTVLLIL